MRRFLIALAALSLSACQTLPGLDKPAGSRTDPLDLKAAAALVTDTPPPKLSAADLAVFSAMHDAALSNCLYWRDKQASAVQLGNLGLSNGDLFLASIAPLAAASKLKGGMVATIAATSTVLATQLKSFVGLPAPSSDFSGAAGGIDYFYKTFSQSPGTAALMAGPQASREAALKSYRIGLQQACISPAKMPSGSSVYDAAKSVPIAGTANVQ